LTPYTGWLTFDSSNVSNLAKSLGGITMKSSVTKTLSVILLVGVAACAQQNNWTPTVDTGNDAHLATLGNDMQACKQLAIQASDQTGTVGEDTGIGMIGGAAGGALLGAMVGAPAMGAGLGAAAGTGIGFGSGAASSDATYKRVYTNCLTKRGHTVLN